VKVIDNTPANTAELRNFGLLTGGLAAAIFGFLFPCLRHRAIPAWPWLACAILWIAALAAPRALKHPFRAWTAFGWALGWINSRVIMTIVFYLLVVPLGVVMRLAGRDRMARSFDPDSASYRVVSRHTSRESMDKPY
jgi:hypothetical protein